MIYAPPTVALEIRAWGQRFERRLLDGWNGLFYLCFGE